MVVVFLYFNCMNKRKTIIQRDSSTCQYCGKYVEDNGIDLHIDHINPKSNGGNNEKNNLMVSCVRCNLIKGGMTIDEFRDKLSNKFNFYIEELNKFLCLKIEKIDSFKFYFEQYGKTKKK